MVCVAELAWKKQLQQSERDGRVGDHDGQRHTVEVILGETLGVSAAHAGAAIGTSLPTMRGCQ